MVTPGAENLGDHWAGPLPCPEPCSQLRLCPSLNPEPRLAWEEVGWRAEIGGEGLAF